MMNKTKILAVIPARAGSKGLPDKNVLIFAGKPLITWTIEAAEKSQYIDHIVVSTDCPKILYMAKQFQDANFRKRPDNLATDEASIESVLHDVIDHCKANKREFDYILLLQPTSPLRDSAYIDRAIEQYFKAKHSDLDSLVSVYPLPQKMGWIMQETASGYIDFCLFDRKTQRRRQNLKTYYMPNGAIYLAPIKSFESSFYTDHTLFFEMPPEDSIDIDTLADFQEAEKRLLVLKK